MSYCPLPAVTARLICKENWECEMGSCPSPEADLRSSIAPTSSPKYCNSHHISKHVQELTHPWESTIGTNYKRCRLSPGPRAAADAQLSWKLYDGARPVKLKRLISSSSHSPAQLVPGDNCRAFCHNFAGNRTSEQLWQHTRPRTQTQRRASSSKPRMHGQGFKPWHFYKPLDWRNS